MSAHDPYVLPEGLPAPEDDGACDHLPGRMLPQLTLESTQGPLSLRALSQDLLVLYVYPRTGRPGRPMPAGWDEIPGARGCTPQSLGFREAYERFGELGAAVAGLSAQPLEDQEEFAERNAIPYPLLADPGLRLAGALGLPTFEVEGRTLYKRLALVVEACAVERVFYPVFPPDENAAEVLSWLESRQAP
jgi:peroxiredoxin